MAGRVSELTMGTTYYFKDQNINKVTLTSNTVGLHWINGYNGQGKMNYYTTWGNGAVCLYNNSTTFTKFNWGKAVGYGDTGDIITMLVDREVRMTLVNGDPSISDHQNMPSRLVIEHPADSGTIYYQNTFKKLSIRETITVDIPENSKVYWGRVGAHFSAYYSYKFETLNEAPTTPKDLKVNSDEVILTGERISLEWSQSTDPEGDNISYEVEMFDGEKWLPIKVDIADTRLEFIVPISHSNKCKFRVRTKDSNDLYSDYVSSNDLKVFRYMILLMNMKGEIINGNNN